MTDGNYKKLVAEQKAEAEARARERKRDIDVAVKALVKVLNHFNGPQFWTRETNKAVQQAINILSGRSAIL